MTRTRTLLLIHLLLLFLLKCSGVQSFNNSKFLFGNNQESNSEGVGSLKGTSGGTLHPAKDYYFLPEGEALSQSETLLQHLTNQMESNQTRFQNTKVNLSTLGFPDLSGFRQIFTGFGDSVKRDGICSGCQVWMAMMISQIKDLRVPGPKLMEITIFTCTYFRLAHPDVCRGVLERLGPHFKYIIESKGRMRPSIVCGVLFQSLGCRIPPKDLIGTEFDWTVETLRVPGHKDPRITVPRPPVKVNRPKWGNLKDTRGRSGIRKIIHLADIHIDPDYKYGATAECDNEVLCCQHWNGVPEDSSKGAGFYGDNRKCDAPMSMLEMALTHMKQEHGDVDLVYMTGDLVPHNVWYSTKEENQGVLRNVSSMLKKYFGDDVILVPCLGNHEPHPVNTFTPTSRTFGGPEKNPIPPHLRTEWVYSTAFESWRSWIPEKEAETFLRSGNFVVEVNPKFRVIVVNTNLCYGFNLWQLYDPQDPGGQLEWLKAQLDLTRNLNATAHIVGHVPPGHEDCFKIWSREFYRLISSPKYRNILKAQFYGHTHYDEFRLPHDPTLKVDPVGVMWIGPSLTPYRIYNPGYRVYHVDPGTMDIIDHETWIYDLDKANSDFEMDKDPSVDIPWFKLYRATEVYEIEDLRPRNLKKFVIKMAKDRKTFDKFYRFYYKSMDPEVGEKKEPCDTVCRKRILCGIVQAYYDDDDGSVECNEIQKQVDGIVLPLRVLEHRKRWIWL